MTSINRWKKVLSFALMLLTLFYSVPASSSSGLFPKSDALFGVTMPDIRFALDREADDTEETPEGEKLIYTSFTPTDYEAFGAYAKAAGMKMGEQSCQDGILTAVLSKDGSTITFQYCYADRMASVFYPTGVRKEQEKSTAKQSGNILPDINRTFGAVIPSLNEVLKNHSASNTENRNGHDEISYSGISIKDYNDINVYLTAIGCTMTESHVENGMLNAALSLRNGVFSIRYDLSNQTFTFVCPELYYVDASLEKTVKTDMLILPSPEESFGAVLPRLSAALLRYPDQKETQADGSYVETYLNFEEKDYTTFSVYLQGTQCAVGDYYIDEKGNLVVPLTLNGSGFVFTYDRIDSRAFVTYPQGAVIEPEIAASLIPTPVPTATPKATATPKPTASPKPTATPKPITKIRINEGSNPNVRSQPSTDGKVLGNAKSGEVYELLATSGNWYKIRMANGTEGWIANGMATVIGTQYIVQNEAKSQTRVNVGSIIRFGNYEQDNNLSNGKEPIEWRVLSIKNNQALVISSVGLDAVSYGKAMDVNEYSKSGLSWKNSDLRKWLNNTFINTAFSKEEQSKIISVQVETTDKTGTYKTNDKVFILSIAEVEKYFSSAADMACSVSKYAKSKLHADGGTITETGLGSWWLRNMTSTYKQADRSNFMDTTYNEAGYVFGNKGVANAKEGKGCPVFCDYLITVRPAMWVSLDDYADNTGITATATPKATVKPTVKPTAKPTPKPTAKPTATPKPQSGYMSDSELIEMAKGYFYLHGGSSNGITGVTIEHDGNISYVAIAYNFHCYIVKLNRKTGLGLSMTKVF